MYRLKAKPLSASFVAMLVVATLPIVYMSGKLTLSVLTHSLRSPLASAQAVMRSAATSHRLSPSGDVSCFLYDRPPRTGSTTMSEALQACLLRRHGFREPTRKQYLNTRRVVTAMIQHLTSKRRALVSNHINIVDEELALIRKRCKQLFYVTGCMPMRRRILSRYKQKRQMNSLRSGREEDMNSDQEQTSKRALNHKGGEPLEFFPYLNDKKEETVLNKDERLVPDYVVRNGPGGYYIDDLTKLLQALGCPTNFKSQNIHGPGNEEVLENITLTMGDATYSRLMKLGADSNEKGLKKAKSFIEMALLEEG